MLLAIDIGNSTVSIGVFEGEVLSVRDLPAEPGPTPEEYMATIEELTNGKAPQGAVMCSVAPESNEALTAALRSICGSAPLIVNSASEHGLTLDIDEPGALGADRLVAAVAAVALYGTPIAVVDLGTATTVDFVVAEDVFRGGAILPGPGLMLKALARSTALLPEVELTPSVPLPGRDTSLAMLSGIVYGTAGAVERIISEFEAGEGAACKVAVTGGYMGLVLPHLRRADYLEPSLTLKGLKLIWERSL